MNYDVILQAREGTYLAIVGTAGRDPQDAAQSVYNLVVVSKGAQAQVLAGRNVDLTERVTVIEDLDANERHVHTFKVDSRGNVRLAPAVCDCCGQDLP